MCCLIKGYVMYSTVCANTQSYITSVTKKKRIKILVFLKFFVSARAVINNLGALLLGLPKSIHDHIFSVVLFNDCDKYLLTENSTMQGQRANRTQPFPYLIS